MSTSETNKAAHVSIGDGQWFNPNSSQMWMEGSYWNGHDHVSRSTGSTTEHQALYLTASKKWILNSYSDFHTSNQEYRILSDQEAAEWFVKNELDTFPESLKEYINRLEI